MIYALLESINQTACHPAPPGKESRNRQSLSSRGEGSRKESQIFIEQCTRIHFSPVTFNNSCFSEEHFGNLLQRVRLSSAAFGTSSIAEASPAPLEWGCLSLQQKTSSPRPPARRQRDEETEYQLIPLIQGRLRHSSVKRCEIH
ncbi:unnamed protein product [Pleuronectes platessa]|uniref:Uncharacterized protein n=1 Tax=Pleuronectes platessa TaxID=8262 RepID=A0A9N7UUC7_PLEPL|nr:unnamed protein product [Pleuronectes platessa]